MYVRGLNTGYYRPRILISSKLGPGVHWIVNFIIIIAGSDLELENGKELIAVALCNLQTNGPMLSDSDFP